MARVLSFNVFQVDTVEDECRAVDVLRELGLENVRVIERDYPAERITITYVRDTPLPLNFRQRMEEKGFIV